MPRKAYAINMAPKADAETLMPGELCAVEYCNLAASYDLIIGMSGRRPRFACCKWHAEFIEADWREAHDVWVTVKGGGRAHITDEYQLAQRTRNAR